MQLQKLGKNTSGVEVQNITPAGIWLLVNQTEYFLPYKNFPWFREARVADIYQVELLYQRHLRWPKLDVDLELASLEDLEKYPLIFK